MPKITTEQFEVSCGCRSVGECNHGGFMELSALNALVDVFALEMKRKLRDAWLRRGRSGWDDPSNIDSLKHGLINHITKGNSGNMVDVANFCAFLWNHEVNGIMETTDIQFKKECLSIGEGIQNACHVLPENWQIHIELKEGSGTVDLIDPDGDSWDYPSNSETFSEQINDAVEFALAKHKRDTEDGDKS
jgi:hypothetical protein